MLVKVDRLCQGLAEIAFDSYPRLAAMISPFGPLDETELASFVLADWEDYV